MKQKIIIGFIVLLGMIARCDAALTISTDNRPLSFGAMRLGEQKELSQFGSYHNEISCSSTNGNPWYVKINVLQPLSMGAETIPLDSLRWRLVWKNGTGTTPYGYTYRAFSLMPDTVYINGPGEAAGATIRLQFVYSLKVPDILVSGVYNAVVRFTLTEIY